MRWLGAARNRLIAGVTAVLVLLLGGCVTNSEFASYRADLQDLRAETDRLRKELPELKAETEKALDAIRRDQADIKADMIDLRTAFQELNGRISTSLHEKEEEARRREALQESLALQLNYLQQRMEVTDARLARLEKYFGLKPPKTPQPPPKEAQVLPSRPMPSQAPAKSGGQKQGASVAPTPRAAATPEPEPEDAYDRAYHLFQTGQTEAARKAFEEFVRRYPRSDLVDNALFWIGETYYRAGNYAQAVLKYREVVKNYPKGSKGPDALLKMGYALEKMHEPQAAAAALEKLIQTYPKSPQRKLAAQKLAKLKAPGTQPEKDKGNEVEQTGKKSAGEKKPAHPEKEKPGKKNRP